MNGEAANLAVLLAPAVPVEEVSTAQLVERVQSTILAQNQAAAIRAETLAELRRRVGAELTESVLRDDGQFPRRRARSELETARLLEQLPKTRKGLRKGEIPYDNARIIAGASRRGMIDEDELLGHARTQSPDKFVATVRRHEQARAQDDGVSRLAHQRSRRFARIKTDRDDGMTVLYGRFDPITGARIETALSQKVNELWREEDPQDRATPGQRMADALELLLTSDGDRNGSSQDVRLLVIADYDAVAGELENVRLSDGTPVPAQALRKLACDAQILPAIFGGSSQPLDLGRARRKASPAQRTALIARDRACIGCGARAAWCQAHHIVHWQDGGPTNLENLVLLCTRCHHKVHDQDWTVHKSPSGRYTLRRPSNASGRPPYRKTYYHRRNTVKQRK